MANPNLETVTPQDRIVASLPFVESVARRVAASMPHSIDLGDLVQDGMVGLIDAAHRFDEGRGIKFETFAERRVRGAMIDALRKDAWPRGVRRQSAASSRRPARQLRREIGAEPSLADLAARVGTDEARLGRTIVRISTIESTSPLAISTAPTSVDAPGRLRADRAADPGSRLRDRPRPQTRVRQALATLPAARAQGHRALLLPTKSTMKQIGAAIGVNESRVSQLHARAIQRLQKALGGGSPPRRSRRSRPRRRARPRGMPPKRRECMTPAAAARPRRASVPYPATSRDDAQRGRDSRNGFGSQRQPLSRGSARLRCRRRRRSRRSPAAPAPA